MALTRKRRILIAVLAVVGILFVVAVKRSTTEMGFYEYLVDHPYCSRVARLAFVVAGKEKEFDAKMSMAVMKHFHPTEVFDVDLLFRQGTSNQPVER